MPPIPFETPPGTAEWNHTITHDDYTKMLNGHTPRDMDDKIWIKAKVIEAQSNAMFHIYYGWNPREVIRLEIVTGDPNNTEAKEWATIVNIWWKKRFSGGEDPITEGEAKKSAVNTCNNMLGCKIEHEDEDKGETEENEDEDKKEKDKG